MVQQRMIKIVLFSLITLLLIPFVNAGTEIFFSTGQTFAEGYVVDFPLFTSFPTNMELNIDFHVYNISTGGLVTSSVASCVGHLFNSTGHHILDNYNIPPAFNHFGWDISAGNITSEGLYGFSIHCNDSAIGGYVSGTFLATKSGYENNYIAAGIVVLILFLLIVMFIGLGLNIKNKKYVPLKLLFLAWGFTMINPLLYMLKRIAEHSQSNVGTMMSSIIIAYMPVYILLLILLWLLYLKDTIKFLKDSAGGIIKEGDDEPETF